MEYLDLYDENQNLIGEKVLRSKDMKPEDGKYIKIVIVFIQNSEGKFLIQKTSKQKGNTWATTGGLVSSGYTADETIVKEIQEELGIVIDFKDIKYIETIKREHAFQSTYYLKKDININELVLQKDEVEFVKWLSIDEIKELIESNEFRKGNILAFKNLLEKEKLI
ncbi:MAG: NUDIX domain-containing protein [Firmicutes bacterium]|nr:NUDIX domain-containing protein [Bacillota bacterium]